MARRYGFLYKCYTPRLPYWETAELLRKLLVALVPVRAGRWVRPQTPPCITHSRHSGAGVCAHPSRWLGTGGSRHGHPPVLPGCHAVLAPLCARRGQRVGGVLWLLLLSGTAAKWAGLDPSSQRSLAAFQLLLASGWAFVLMCMAALALMQAARGTSAVQPGDSGCARAESSIGALGSAALPPVAQPPHEHTLPL